MAESRLDSLTVVLVCESRGGTYHHLISRDISSVGSNLRTNGSVRASVSQDIRPDPVPDARTVGNSEMNEGNRLSGDGLSDPSALTALQIFDNCIMS